MSVRAPDTTQRTDIAEIASYSSRREDGEVFRRRKSQIAIVLAAPQKAQWDKTCDNGEVKRWKNCRAQGC